MIKKACHDICKYTLCRRCARLNKLLKNALFEYEIKLYVFLLGIFRFRLGVFKPSTFPSLTDISQKTSQYKTVAKKLEKIELLQRRADFAWVPDINRFTHSGIVYLGLQNLKVSIQA